MVLPSVVGLIKVVQALNVVYELALKCVELMVTGVVLVEARQLLIER
jgi:hypothetical protein